MGAVIKGLRQTEQDWIEQATLLAINLAKYYNVAGDRPKLTPALLDQTYAAWLANPRQDLEATGVFNAIGVAFGQYLVDHAGMRWVVYSKDGETNIAAYRAQGKVVVFPTHLIRKRYFSRETGFLAPMYYDMVKSMNVAAKPQQQPKAPWWKLGLQTN
jgi:hypothetical protein